MLWHLNLNSLSTRLSYKSTFCIFVDDIHIVDKHLLFRATVSEQMFTIISVGHVSQHLVWKVVI